MTNAASLSQPKGQPGIVLTFPLPEGGQPPAFGCTVMSRELVERLIEATRAA